MNLSLRDFRLLKVEAISSLHDPKFVSRELNRETKQIDSIIFIRLSSFQGVLLPAGKWEGFRGIGAQFVLDHGDGFLEGSIEIAAFGGDDVLGADETGKAEAAQGNGTKAFQAGFNILAVNDIFEDLTDENTQEGDLIGETFELMPVEVTLNDLLNWRE